VRAAIYARVSTVDQEPENQLQELRRYVEARSWPGVEYVDKGVSGAKDRGPALDQLLADARRRRFDVVVCWRLDRLGRNLKHLIALLDELQALGVAFVSLAEGIDATTPAGKLQMHILRDRGIRARAHPGTGAGGPPTRQETRKTPWATRAAIPIDRVRKVSGRSVGEAALNLGVLRSTLKRWRRQVAESGCRDQTTGVEE